MALLNQDKLIILNDKHNVFPVLVKNIFIFSMGFFYYYSKEDSKMVQHHGRQQLGKIYHHLETVVLNLLPRPRQHLQIITVVTVQQQNSNLNNLILCENPFSVLTVGEG